MIAFGKAFGVRVVAWRVQLTRGADVVISNRDSTGNHRKQLYEHFPQLTRYFAVGAPAIELCNLNPARNLANGSMGVMHSLCLDPKESLQDFEMNYVNLPPGEILMLLHPPTSVNLAFPAMKSEEWPDDCRLEDEFGRIVVPFPPTSSKEGSVRVNRHTKYTFKEPFVDLAFSLTFWKIQGCTLDRIILGFTDLKGTGGKVNLTHLYVALSRVRRGADLRVMPGNLTHLCKFQWPLANVVWEQNLVLAKEVYLADGAIFPFYKLDVESGRMAMRARCPVAPVKKERRSAAAAHSKQGAMTATAAPPSGHTAPTVPIRAPTESERAQRNAAIRMRADAAREAQLRAARAQATQRKDSHFARLSILPPLPLPSVADLRAQHDAHAIVSPSGLPNFGNSCYMNALMQAVAATSPLRASLLLAASRASDFGIANDVRILIAAADVLRVVLTPRPPDHPLIVTERESEASLSLYHLVVAAHPHITDFPFKGAGDPSEFFIVLISILFSDVIIVEEHMRQVELEVADDPEAVAVQVTHRHAETRNHWFPLLPVINVREDTLPTLLQALHLGDIELLPPLHAVLSVRACLPLLVCAVCSYHGLLFVPGVCA